MEDSGCQKTAMIKWKESGAWKQIKCLKSYFWDFEWKTELEINMKEENVRKWKNKKREKWQRKWLVGKKKKIGKDYMVVRGIFSGGKKEN